MRLLFSHRDQVSHFVFCRRSRELNSTSSWHEKRQEDYKQFFGGGSWEFCKGLETLLTSQRKQDHKQSNIDENGVDDDDGVAGVDGNGTGQMVSAKPGPLTMSLMSQSIWRYHQIDKCYHEQALPMARSIH